MSNGLDRDSSASTPERPSDAAIIRRIVEINDHLYIVNWVVDNSTRSCIAVFELIDGVQHQIGQTFSVECSSDEDPEEKPETFIAMALERANAEQ